MTYEEIETLLREHGGESAIDALAAAVKAEAHRIVSDDSPPLQETALAKLAGANAELGRSCVELILQVKEVKNRESLERELHLLADRRNAPVFSEHGRELSVMERLEEAMTRPDQPSLAPAPAVKLPTIVPLVSDGEHALLLLACWAAETIHGKYHLKEEERRQTWHDCSRGFCVSIRSGIQRAGYAPITVPAEIGGPG